MNWLIVDKDQVSNIRCLSKHNIVYQIQGQNKFILQITKKNQNVLSRQMKLALLEQIPYEYLSKLKEIKQ